jgi:hypothetical protein
VLKFRSFSRQQMIFQALFAMLALAGFYVANHELNVKDVANSRIHMFIRSSFLHNSDNLINERSVKLERVREFKKSGRELSSHDNTQNHPFTKILQVYGGPICKDHIGIKALANSCPKRPCGEYDLWYNDVYKGITPSINTATFQNSHYFNSPFIHHPRPKVVISLGHNGIGNEFFQHYFAQRVAEHVHAAMFAATLGDDLTSVGAGDRSRRGLDEAMEWAALPESHPAREICRQSNFSYTKRPVDMRRANRTEFDAQLREFLIPDGTINCLITYGFFHYRDTCRDSATKMWKHLTSEESLRNISSSPGYVALGPRDMVVAFSCDVGSASYISKSFDR